jgi:hypothetical protein
MIRLGGQRVVGFGVGDDILDRFAKSEDPLYDCHHDTYTKLQTFGTVIVTAAVTAGIIFIGVPWFSERRG